ncbi:MAG: hypothetical protein PVJ66_02480 [Gammaproteobacteria bacterium]
MRQVPVSCQWPARQDQNSVAGADLDNHQGKHQAAGHEPQNQGIRQH